MISYGMSEENTGDQVRRLHLRLEGRVQGVGFRYTTVDVARNHTVTGFVRNEMDGSVTVTAEGRESELEAFVQDLYRSQVGTFIRGQHRCWSEADGSFRGFKVRYD